jgi:predicted metal-dependent hydrolase
MAFSEKTIDHQRFGKIIVVRSTRASRISISVKPFEPLKLTIPVFVSQNRAEDFLTEKEAWISRNLEKIKKFEDQYTVFTEETEFRTYEHELVISRFSDEDPIVSLKDKTIQVNLPEKSDIKDPAIQEMIRWGIQAAWRKEARKHLPARLSELSRKHGFTYNKVIIKNNRSRWGSCSEKNNINLSLHLMRLPEHLVDYILMHELVHTVHKNHGKKFWREFEKILPGAKATDRELREYRIDIY